MIAVYYSYGLNNQKEGMFFLPVKDDDHATFLEALENNKEYPFPDSEVLFIENDKVVNTWNIHE